MEIPFLDLKKVNALFEPRLSSEMASVVASGIYLNGNCNAAFEERFARFCGCRYCVGTGNGLDALTLILMAMKQRFHWTEASEVIVPAFTFVATAEAVCRAGLTPVFCDIRLDDFLLHAADAERCITPQTKALLPVHLYGKACDMRAFRSLADAYGLKLVEDAAQAHGAASFGRRAGNCGDAAAFSFYPGKNLGALGDGGAVTTNDEELASAVRILANYGAERKYHHVYLGMNSRLDEIQAAALNVKLSQLEAHNKKRQEVAAYYGDHVRNPWVKLPYDGDSEACVFHIYAVRTPFRERLQEFLSRRGVCTLVHYPIPVHRQKAFAAFNRLSFPQAEQAAREELSLPVSPALTVSELEYIANTLNQFKP